jgi:hypothetical protein
MSGVISIFPKPSRAWVALEIRAQPEAYSSTRKDLACSNPSLLIHFPLPVFPIAFIVAAINTSG